MTRPVDDGVFLPSPTADTPLLAWLLEALRPMNRTRVKELLKHGRVRVNGVATTRHDFVVCPGDCVRVARGVCDRSLETGNIAIVFEDDALIAIDKPPGLLTVATDAEKIDTAFARLRAHLASRDRGRPFVVHRLDRETSGLLLFARSATVRDRLQSEWEQVTKTYLALVEGAPRPPVGTVDNFLAEGRDLRVRPVSRERGRRAVTHYRVLAEREACSLVEITLETGRKHQIRVHMAALGCPVVGDPVYGTTRRARRMGLHAERLSFDHPVTGMRLELRAPPPDAFS